MRQTNRMIQKTVGIPIHVLIELEEYSDASSISVADAIRIALIEFLAKHAPSKTINNNEN